jgi:hypothetical protein
MNSAKAFKSELPGLWSDRVELFSLELHRAGLALAQVVMLVIAAAILGITAWLVVWGTIAAALTIFANLHWLLSLLIVFALNGVAALWAVSRIKRLLPLLRMPATLRHLKFSPSTTAPSEPFRPDPSHESNVELSRARPQ